MATSYFQPASTRSRALDPRLTCQRYTVGAYSLDLAVATHLLDRRGTKSLSRWAVKNAHYHQQQQHQKH
eukprot:scaffold3031_cov285-Pinguiococcus_pyrenoidosus.AAC.2